MFSLFSFFFEEVSFFHLASDPLSRRQKTRAPKSLRALSHQFGL